METFYKIAFESWGVEEIQAIERVTRSRQFTIHKEVKEFETAFAKTLGVKHAVMVSSGSMANLIAVASLCYKKERPLLPNAKIIVPAIARATTYAPLHQMGLRMKICDVHPGTFNLPNSGIEDLIDSETQAIVAVNILGNPAPLNYLRSLCDKHEIYLIEDNCESLGAKLDGTFCGTFGHLGTHSTFFSHHISTMEGGVIVTDDEELYELCLCLRAYGWTRDLPKNSLLYQTRKGDQFERYRFILPGYNARPLEFAGATGQTQLKKLETFVHKRRENAKIFMSHFSNDRRFQTQEQNGEGAFFAFPLVAKDPSMYSYMVEALHKNGIEYRSITGGNILAHDVSQMYSIEHSTLEHAEYIHRNGFFVGNGPVDLSAQLEHLEKTLRDI